MRGLAVFISDIRNCKSKEAEIKKKKKRKTKIVASGSITSWQIDGGRVETVRDFIVFVAPKSLQMVIAAMKLKDAYSLKEKL